LEKEIEKLTAQKNQIEKDNAEWRNDQRDCSAIPSKEVLDRIQRYETSNVRHRYRVEARLELLQKRQRKTANSNSGEGGGAEGSQDTQFCETKPTGSDDDGLRKGPRSIGLAEQTSNDIATPPIKTDVTGGN